MKKMLMAMAFALLSVTLNAADVARPPMGWNSWNWFGKSGINETVVREVVAAMATNGLRDAGYGYIVWMGDGVIRAWDSAASCGRTRRNFPPGSNPWLTWRTRMDSNSVSTPSQELTIAVGTRWAASGMNQFS